MDKTIVRTVPPAPLPAALASWLAKLTLLHGVPFNYLVADARVLAPETIKFFEVDPTWSEALLDGALSIGRHYTASDAPSGSLVAETIGRADITGSVNELVPAIRRRQLKQADAGAPDPGPNVMTGFLLRSRVVSGWKSLDVLGYARGHSPYESEHGTLDPAEVKALGLLRLERLSPTVLFGLFAGSLYQLVLHQPPEAIHFGFDTLEAGASVTKNLRVPDTSWEDHAARFTSLSEQHQPFDKVFADAAHRVVDLAQLSRVVAARLAGAGKAPGYYAAAPDPTDEHQDHLVSSDFALEMVKGVGYVSFVNRPLPQAHP